MERPISRDPSFVLVHGWGFNGELWRELAPRLPGPVTIVDLGFIGEGSEPTVPTVTDAIAIGHSLGALWLLKKTRGLRRLRGFVSIQGFDRFCPHNSPAKVMTMRRSLKRDAHATLKAFWRACGTEPFAPKESLHEARLDEGLGWLLEWDATAELAALACPVLALAAHDDAIVPRSMSEAIFGPTLKWSQFGGHVLPLRAPEWCLTHVLDFARRLEP